MTTSLESLPLVAIPPDDEALRAPVRAFLQQTLGDVPPHVRARTWMGYDADFSRSLAKQGWLGLALPKAYGGAGRSAFARFVLVEELIAAGAPVSAHWFADRQTAPLILKFGTPAQRDFFVPRMVRGEIFMSIGMSEPDTGSDLSSVRTRAVRTETGWRLNGRKIWTTNAHRTQYMCALVRTSGQHGDRHKGLSQVLIDLSLPGISYRPIKDLAGDAHFCEVVFEDVELPADAIVGEEGSGWKQVSAELAFERSGPERILTSLLLAETWLAEVRASGLPAPDSVKVIAGRIAGRIAALRAMSLAVADLLDKGQNPETDAAYVKDLGTEFEQAVPGWIASAIEQMPDFQPSETLQRALAYITQLCPSFSLRGGTRQILRGIIARSLGLR